MSADTPVCRILLCEDSLTFATGLTRFLECDADLKVAARCASAEEALAQLGRVKPDLVVMDIELPGIDGVEATRRIMAARPVPVLILSGNAPRGSQQAVVALASGAVDVRSKDEVPIRDPGGARAIAFRRYVKRLAAARVAPRARRPATASRPKSGRSAAIIGVAASTGGPPALRSLLAALPADFPIPVVVVQHIATGFLDGLIRWLDAEVELPVKLASEMTRFGPGAWIAPEGAHLVVEPGLVARHDRHTVAGYHRPAADVLFASLASTAGADAVAVVLTGLGNDGAEGASVVRRAGGLTIAQDEASSVVHGMPRAAAELGADEVLPLAQIGPMLKQLSVARPRG